MKIKRGLMVVTLTALGIGMAWAQVAPAVIAVTKGLTVNASGGLVEHAFTVNENGVMRFAVEGQAVDGRTDIDFRTATINVGTTEASDRTNLDFYVDILATGQTIRTFKPGSTTQQAFAVGVNGDVALNTVGQATNAFTIRQWGMQPTYQILSATGRQGWGPGGAAALDTFLERTSPGWMVAPSLALPAVQTLDATVGTLPVCNAAAGGQRRHVTDSGVTAFGSTVVGGGAATVPVFCNKSAWVVG